MDQGADSGADTAPFAPAVSADDAGGCGHAGGTAGEALISPLRLRRSVPAEKKRTLLIVPPFCSPNYTYPAPAYLARLLKRHGQPVAQVDLNLELLLRLFSKKGLLQVFAAASERTATLSPESRRVLALRDRYVYTIEPVIRFLQGRDPSIAYRMCQPDFLPRGRNFELNKGFDFYDGHGNTLAVHDRAKFVGTLFLYDLGEMIREAIFPYFQITLVDRYYDSFVHRCTTFDLMQAELEREPSVIDQMLHEVFDAHLESVRPDLVGVTVPFARNLYWAFRIGRRVRRWDERAKVVMGGGFFNTSMRDQKEPRLFDYVDYITLDDGEKPLLNILSHLQGGRAAHDLKRTWRRDTRDGTLRYEDGDPEPDIRHAETGAPDYTGYRIGDYFSSLETTNINQRVRSDGWWNKLTMTHGCYWKKCSFCDIHLSYVGDYDTATAQNLVDKVEQVIAQTGHTGFHFVDEAMPPKVMRDFALEVLRRDLAISWHGMLRFDKAYTPELCRLLAASGLIAVFGGLEVASDRLLALMKKGTTVLQVAQVAKNFKDAGIKVHGYIMYGFPTQTAQETIDALEVVRQLFKHGLLTSASWAKFGVTPHSPIGRNPDEYKIKLLPIEEGAFVEQIIPHLDPTGCDHDKYTAGLQEALRYYSLGFHYDAPAESWFKFPVPLVSIDRELIGQVMKPAEPQQAQRGKSEAPQRDRRVLWLGPPPSLRLLPAAEGHVPQAELTLHAARGDHRLSMPAAWAQWLSRVLETSCVKSRGQEAADAPVSLKELEESWNASIRPPAAAAATPASAGDSTVEAAAVTGAASFDAFLQSEVWQALLERGLILTQQRQRVIWTGATPQVKPLATPPARPGEPRAELVFPPEGREAPDAPGDPAAASGAPGTFDPPALSMPAAWASWLAEVLKRSQPGAEQMIDLAELRRSFAREVERPPGPALPPALLEDQPPFKDFLRSPVWQTLLERGLALV